ncbi:holin [Nocardia sp. JCM 34519.1]|uniref:holin n=1 Tax=unclassified Nocardia TaxID=2637762 RepID=UPI001CE457A0
MWTLLFWRAAAERALKTFAQALAAVLTSGSIGLFDPSWRGALSTAAMAAILSVLTSIASDYAAEPGNPSLVRTTGSQTLETSRVKTLPDLDQSA